MNEINFFEEDIEFSFPNANQSKSWLKFVIESEDYKLDALNYIFCTDEYLHNINKQYLDHDTYTDIITFDQSDEASMVAGDIFISIDRIKENAHQLGCSEVEELHRVLVHGVLHLMGFNDSTDEEKLAMRKKEEACLSLQKI